MNELLLVATIAGQEVALRSSDVDSVVEIESLVAAPRTPAHIVGLSALRSRVLTVIDCRCSLGLAMCEADEADEADGADGAGEPVAACRQAVVVERSGHYYALLVDRVEDVIESRSELLPTQSRQGEGWRRVSLGMIETSRGILNVVDSKAFIAGPETVRSA